MLKDSINVCMYNINVYICNVIKQQKTTAMKTTKEFLSENRGEVINFYNEKINGFYNVTLVEFMTDLMNNFKKITLGEELRKFDLFGNLEDAKKRLGLFDNAVFAPSDRDKKLAEKYKGTAYMALV